MEEKILRKHIQDQIRKALVNGSGSTKFLTPKEQQEALAHIAAEKLESQVKVLTDGGFQEAERNRLILLNQEWGSYNRKEMIAALSINMRNQDKIEHRDILGALMNLGIERNTLGDIETKGEKPIIITLPSIAIYIMENLTKIGNVGVKLESVDIEDLGPRIIDLEKREIISTSMRLDCLLAEIFNLSRKEATSLIQQGKVSHNYKIASKQDAEVKEGDELTLRGKGKIKILTIEGRTKKDRLKIKIGKYI